jgi:hypothetical protein
LVCFIGNVPVLKKKNKLEYKQYLLFLFIRIIIIFGIPVSIKKRIRLVGFIGNIKVIRLVSLEFKNFWKNFFEDEGTRLVLVVSLGNKKLDIL